MKKSTFAGILLCALASGLSAQAQQTDTANKPTKHTLSAEQRATQKAASKARFAAMSPEEKVAHKGNKQKPTRPAKPTGSQGRS
jgi:hypothetical protein